MNISTNSWAKSNLFFSYFFGLIDKTITSYKRVCETTFRNKNPFIVLKIERSCCYHHLRSSNWTQNPSTILHFVHIKKIYLRKNTKMTPLLLIIADESLSMRSRKLEILDGINQFIDVQRKVSAEDGRLILVKFNNLVTFLHKGK